jgi:hypothetical protein
MTNGLNHSTANNQVSWLEASISLAIPFIALLLPLSALIFTSSKKLLNQDVSENILGLPTYVQGIWILIYAVLLVLFIWQVLPKAHEPKRSNSVVFPIALSLAINAIWLLIDAPIWSVGIELLWIASLVFAYRFLESDSAKTRKLWLTQAGTGLYLGWVTVTMAITVSNLLLSSWNGLLFHPIFWASTVILSLAGLGLFLALRYNDIFFNLALVWAFAGYIFRSPLDPALMPALMVALASTVFAIVREPQQKAQPMSVESRRTVSDL